MGSHISAIGFLALVLTSVSCSKQSVESLSSSNQTYVKALYSMPRTLDPIKMNDTASLVVSNLIYDGLLRFTKDLSYEGALAESWSVDKSGRIYTFILRQAKFHDGSSVTPESVVKSLSRAVSKQSTVYKYYDCVVGAEEYYQGKVKTVRGLKVVSPLEISIELKYPFPPFLSVLAGATAKILPTNVDEKSNYFENPIGSGPFKVSELKRTSSDFGEILLSRFDQYSGSKAKVSKLKLIAISESEAQSLAAQNKIDDLANYPLSGTEEIFKRGKDVASPVAATWIIGINSRMTPFKNLNVRKSFKDTVDSEGFKQKFYPDAITANGYIPNGLPGHSLEKISTAKNKLITTKEKITIAIPEGLAKEKEMREFLENDFRKQGWNVSVVPMSWQKMMEGYDKKTLQAFIVSMNMDYPDTEFLIRNFESNNPDNFSGISDDKLDDLIRLARKTQDRQTRNGIYKEVADRIEDLAVTVNLFHPRSHSWIGSCVKNFVPNILADYYIDYRNVEIAEHCVRGDRS